MPLNERSLKNLEGVHADLVKVVKRAAELLPCPLDLIELSGPEGALTPSRA